jgi:hypothetical protein
LVFILLILIFGVVEKTFDEKIILLFLKEKNKLIYINGIAGAFVNSVEIIYLCHLYKKEKQIFVSEKTEESLIANYLPAGQYVEKTINLNKK